MKVLMKKGLKGQKKDNARDEEDKVKEEEKDKQFLIHLAFIFFFPPSLHLVFAFVSIVATIQQRTCELQSIAIEQTSKLRLIVFALFHSLPLFLFSPPFCCSS